MGRKWGKSWQTCPLAVCITLPFALLGLLFALVLIVAGSNALGAAVKDEASLFAREFGDRLSGYLRTFFRDPAQAGATTVDRILNGDLDIRDRTSIEKELVPKIRHYPWLTFSAIALPDGSYTSASRSPENGTLLLFESDPSTNFRQYRREIDKGDKPGHLLAIGQSFDPRARPWYIEASGEAEPFWTMPSALSPYALYGMAIAYPVRDETKRLVAVVHCGVALVQVSKFLKDALPEPTALAFIIDASGTILASSSQLAQSGEGLAPQGSESSPGPLIRDAGTRMRGGRQSSYHFRSGGRSWSLLLQPFHGPAGLELETGVLLDEGKFAGPLEDFRRVAMFLVLGAAMVMASLGYLVGRAIARPVVELGNRAARLASGLWAEERRRPGMVKEIRELSSSFETMASKLKTTLDGLESTVARRTAELETLLREVNHRIKNSLQIASSLLSMQAATPGSKDSSEALLMAAGRIDSMALLYNHLHLSPDLRNVDLGSYVGELLDAVAASSIGPRPIAIERSLEPILATAKVASSLGIIINELVTNAFKYAFPWGEEGRISLRLSRCAAGLRIEVADDGRGFPPGFEQERDGGFGLTIASELARELGGRLSIGSPGGKGSLLSLEVPTGIAEA